MTKRIVCAAAVAMLACSITSRKVGADGSVQPLPFAQAWTDANAISRDDDWSGVPGIVGYRGDDLTTATGVDPRTLLAPAGPPGPVIDVIANQSNPDTLTSGGVAEFDGIPNRTIALQGSGTADAPNIVVGVSTRGKQNIRVRYNLRDIDGSADNAVQPVALQFRVGDSGNFANVPAAYVADATTGPNLATQVTPVDIVLPAAADNQARVELRIITTNAVGNDEWVGIDDIGVDGDAIGAGCGVIDVRPESLPAGVAQSSYTQTIAATGASGATTFSITSGAPPRGLALDPGGSLAGFILNAGTFAFTVTAVDASKCSASRQYSMIVRDAAATFGIGAVQGPGAESPYVGQSVSVQGVVTAVTSIGFFVQSPDGATDGDPDSSEALFAFLGTGPAKPPRGAMVTVSGTVVEFRPAGDPGPTVTQLGTGGAVASYSVNQPAAALPEPVALGPRDLDPNGPYDPNTRWDPLERYEGMRVTFDRRGRVVAPTDGGGTFYAVLHTLDYRPRREPGVERNYDLPPVSERPASAGSYAPLLFDTNPEVFGVLTNGQTGAALVNVATGVTVTRLTGVLDYLESTYTVRPDPGALLVTASTLAPVAVREPFANEFTVATMNLERIAARQDAGFQYAKVANSIVNYLGLPDIIAVEELASLAALQELAAAANQAAAGAGQQPLYAAYLEPSPNDVIHVGFLVKSARVTVNSIRQVGVAERFGGSDLNDRPPLILRATVNGPGRPRVPITVVAVHQRSLLGATSLTGDGASARAKRQAQSEFLSNLLGGNGQEPNLPNERTIVLGDFNAYEVNDGYVDVVNAARGAPANPSQVFLPNQDNIAADYLNLYSLLPDQERYSYIFRGDAQPLDHILVSPALAPAVSGFSVLHVNAEYPSALKGSDPTVRYSDHDNPIAYFFLNPPTPVETGAVTTGSGWSYNQHTQTYAATITVTNTSPRTLVGPLMLSLAGLPPGASVVDPSGTYLGAPYLALTNGSLAAGQSASATVRLSYSGATGLAFTPAVYSAGLTSPN